MTPTFPLGVAASWARVVAVFVLDVALLAAGTAAAGRTGWWVGAALGLLVTVAALVSWRGCALLTLAWRLARRPSGTIAPVGVLLDHDRIFGDSPVGIRAVGTAFGGGRRCRRPAAHPLGARSSSRRVVIDVAARRGR